MTCGAFDVRLAIRCGHQRSWVSVNVVKVVGQRVRRVPGDLAVGNRARPVTGDGRAPNGGRVWDVGYVYRMGVCQAKTLIQPSRSGVHSVDGLDGVSSHALDGNCPVVARKANRGPVELVGFGIGAGPVSEAGSSRWNCERVAEFGCVSLVDEITAPQNDRASAGICPAIAQCPTMGGVAGSAAMTVDIVGTEDVVCDCESLRRS